MKPLLKWLNAKSCGMGENLKNLINGRPAPGDALLLAGSGRSGTTWLADMLCSTPGIQQIFEPEHPKYITQVRSLGGFECRDPNIRRYYLRPNANEPGWAQYWHDVLVGKIRNYWTDQVRTSWLPDRYLIKVIRANMMLGYVYDQYQPHIIYLTRHPCAVVYSRLRKVAHPWHADVSDILCHEQLVEDHLRPWLKQIEAEKDEIGAHAVWWAVENMVAQRHLKIRPHYMVAYEALSLDTEDVLRKLCIFCGIDFDKVDLSRITRPSRMATPGTFIHSTQERLSEWQKGLDHSEQQRILDWAQRLGVSQYNDQVLPIS